jgi:hypothetical protein
VVAVAQGVYVDIGGEDVGGDAIYFLVAGEPPDGQFLLCDGTWKPLTDGFYLMNRLIVGDVDIDGPMADPPAGVPRSPIEV